MTTKHKAKKPQPQAHKPQQEVITGVPARIVDEGRKTSHHIIDTLAKTAMAITGGADAEQKLTVIERLWAMQKDAEDRQAEREFGIAKVSLAHELPAIPKNHMIDFVDKQNVRHQHPYADRADIESVLDPICRKHGFSKEYSTEVNANNLARQVLTVRHVSGHKEVYYSPFMPIDQTGSKNANQAAGSTSEYGKRYALIGAFNIIGVDKDDDGNLGKDGATAKGDKFAERVADDATKPDTSKSKTGGKLTLPEAAQALESKLRNAPMEKRGEILMGHINIIGAMEKDANLSEKAAELRKLCEEQPNVAQPD